MTLNLPNLLTWLRIILIPLTVGVFYLGGEWLSAHEKNLVATVFFVVAAVTDWLDGWIARRYNQTSAFGAFLDPVADKLMVAAALIVLVQLGRVDALIALIIVGREIAISALREWMAQIGAARHVAVSTRATGVVIEDATLAQMGWQREVAVRCQNYTTALRLIGDSDLLLTVPTRLAEELAPRQRLQRWPLPFALPAVQLHVYWHAHREGDPANDWLRARVLSLAA